MDDRKTYLMNIGRLAQTFGFVPIPIFGKIPKFRNWPNVRIDPSDPEKNIRRIEHLYDARIANNVGVLTGEVSGIVVVDIEQPFVSWWEELVKANGGLPETFTVQTGTGGLHVYFKYVSPVDLLHNLNKVMNQGFDFRTNGGVIVFPGSIDARTNNMYAVKSGYVDGKPVISLMPKWLFDLLYNDQQRKSFKK